MARGEGGSVSSARSFRARITLDPQVRFGKPCIRGHRITVQGILEWLSSGASQEQILADFPQLEVEDFRLCRRVGG